MATLKNHHTTTIFTISQYHTTATTTIPTTLSIPTPITYELKKKPSPHIGGGSESRCKGYTCNCCVSNIFKFLLSGTDGGGSGIYTIVVLVMA